MKKKSSIHIEEKKHKDNEIVFHDRKNSFALDSGSQKILVQIDQKDSFSRIWGLLILVLLIIIVIGVYLSWPASDPIEFEEEIAALEVSSTDYEPQAEAWKHYVQEIILEEDMLTYISRKGGMKAIDWPTIRQIELILSWSIGLRNMGEGDTIRLLWEFPIKAAMPALDKKRILALSLKTRALDTSLYAIGFEKDGVRSFYDQEGVIWKRAFLRSPIKYARVSSGFNLSRLHPILKKIKPHRGTDFAALEGEDVLALASGIVDRKGSDKFNGNYISIVHGPDTIYKTMYLHLEDFFPGLEIGDKVEQGQVIGYVGQTGSATGPHVCLRFKRRNHQDDFLKSFPYLHKPPKLRGEVGQNFRVHKDSLLVKLGE